jgi:outer membrane protein assembly factor BamB
MYLYIGCNGHVLAINPSDGLEIWRTPLTAGLFGTTSFMDVCVLEHDGTVFAGSNGHLFALDGATGEMLWHNNLEGLGHNDVTLTMAGKSAQSTSTKSQLDSTS